VTSIYQFVGGSSPATTPRASLPVLPKSAYAAACDLFDEIAATAGLASLASRNGGKAPLKCFELEADTEVDTREFGAMTVAEIERLLRRRDGPKDLRCSGSFHDQARKRTDSHLIGWGRYGISIYDTMEETTWHRRERGPSAQLFDFLTQLRERKYP
jgi:hypothetical protein